MAGGIATAKSDFDIIEEIIQIWIKRHPQEWRDFKFAIMEARKELKDPKFAEGSDKRVRKIGMFPGETKWRGKPDNLMLTIQNILPTLFKKESQAIRAEFFRRFGVFRVAEKI